MAKTQTDDEVKLDLVPINKATLARIERYGDGCQNFISVMTPVFPANVLEAKSGFVGETVLVFNNKQSTKVYFEFPDATTLEQAVDQWSEVCEAACRSAVKRAVSQQTRSRILGANGQPS